MYPTDIKEFTASRLVARIAKALATGAPLELGPLYEELDLKPSTIAAYHAAAAAVHVLLATSDSAPSAGALPARLEAPNGHRGKLLAAGLQAPPPPAAQRPAARNRSRRPTSIRK